VFLPDELYIPQFSAWARPRKRRLRGLLPKRDSMKYRLLRPVRANPITLTIRSKKVS